MLPESRQIGIFTIGDDVGPRVDLVEYVAENLLRGELSADRKRTRLVTLMRNGHDPLDCAHELLGGWVLAQQLVRARLDE